MITDTVKGYVFGAVAAVLALSLIGNIILNNTVVSLRDDLSKSESLAKQAQGAAETCSASVTKLEADAKALAALNKPKVEAAKKAETTHAQKAQTILITPPSVPGNDCKSAAARAREWLKVQE